MQFNSLAFAAFMAVVLPLYFALGRRPRSVGAQNLLLLVASYFFYAWWNWHFLGLLAASTLIDYVVGRALAAQDRVDEDPVEPPGGDGLFLPLARLFSRRGLLLISLTANLGILGVFKYFDFFVKSAAALLARFGFEPNLPLLNVALPIGISFFTFQTIAYTYSVYKRDTPATRDLVAFAVYVAYFPQLVAGPIERARMLLPQIQRPRHVTGHAFRSGCQLVLQGLFKKIAIADAVAGYVDAVFSDPGAASSGTLLLGVYMFALQIYGDFSGYTDIARGVSRALGIELILNFRQPYLAANITDFWRRWHISLSTWLREHVYIPLGGNRHGTAKTYRNLLLTMLLGGLWHGAGWNFVVWGGLHGLYLGVHKYWLGRTGRSPEEPERGLRAVVGVFFTFHLVCLAWIFFRAKGIGVAWHVIEGICAFDMRLTDQVPVAAPGLLVLSFLLDYLCVSRNQQVFIDVRMPAFFRSMVYGAAIVTMIISPSVGDVPFIYFQF